MNEWVDSSKKMPRNGKDVLLYRPETPDHVPFVEVGSHDRGVWNDVHGRNSEWSDAPTHWMALPSMPRVAK